MSIPFAGGYLSFTKWGPFAVPRFIKVTPGNKKKATPEVEIVGLKDAVLSHKTESGTALTETTFDTVTRPDEARILFTNASGASQVITACWIRGKLVKKVGGDSGYSHDSHVDYEAIARDGENKFELGNDWVVTLTQVNKLADYHWKYNKTKKHIYTVSLAGVQSWFEPGEWYQLTIGAAGTAEYIDSVVECYSVRTSYNATGSFGTQVSFREVEENWKFDSNAMARYVAAGGHSRVPQESRTIVGAANYPGYANFYCPGTSDDAAVIQAAIDATTGEVHLTRGTYYIAETISLHSSLQLTGEGAGTNLRTSGLSGGADDCIDASGVSTAYNTDMLIADLTITEPVGAVSNGNLIGAYYTRNLTIENNSLVSNGATPVYCNSAKFCSIVNNNVTASATGASTADPIFYAGIFLSGDNSIIAQNYVHDAFLDGYGGIAIGAGGTTYANNIVVNNIVDNIVNYTTSSTDTVAGIYVNCNYSEISSNKVLGTKFAASTAYGIYNSTNSVNMTFNNNFCRNNGNDTGIGTTARNNFYDGGSNSLVG